MPSRRFVSLSLSLARRFHSYLERIVNYYDTYTRIYAFLFELIKSLAKCSRIYYSWSVTPNFLINSSDYAVSKVLCLRCLHNTIRYFQLMLALHANIYIQTKWMKLKNFTNNLSQGKSSFFFINL